MVFSTLLYYCDHLWCVASSLRPIEEFRSIVNKFVITYLLLILTSFYHNNSICCDEPEKREVESVWMKKRDTD